MTISHIKQIFVLLLTIFVLNIFSVSFASEHWAKETYDSFVSKGFIENDLELDKYLSKLNANSILNIFFSTSEQYFLSNDVSENISREEACAQLSKTLQYDLSDSKPNFTDNLDISTWALPYVYAAQENGLIIGYPDGSFRPKDLITNAEFITMLSRAKGSGGIDNPEILDWIDKEITDIEIGMLNYYSGEIKSIVVDKQMNLSSGDSVIISIQLPEDATNDELLYEVKDDKVLTYDETTGYLTALSSGETIFKVSTIDGKYQKDISIFIK